MAFLTGSHLIRIGRIGDTFHTNMAVPLRNSTVRTLQADGGPPVSLAASCYCFLPICTLQP